MKSKIIRYFIIFISFVSRVNVYSQYFFGAQAGYIRSGFTSFHKPDKDFNQKSGLRDGYGANIFFESINDSTKTKLKFEIGYLKQNAFLDVEGHQHDGKIPSGKRYGRKVNYSFDNINLNIIYAHKIVYRKSFVINVLIGLSFNRNFKFEEKGVGWDYIYGFAQDSLGNYYNFEKNENWEVNSTHFNRTVVIAPTVGLELVYHLNSKVDFLFQNKGFVCGSPVKVERYYFYNYTGIISNFGFRYRL